METYITNGLEQLLDLQLTYTCEKSGRDRPPRYHHARLREPHLKNRKCSVFATLSFLWLGVVFCFGGHGSWFVFDSDECRVETHRRLFPVIQCIHFVSCWHGHSIEIRFREDGMVACSGPYNQVWWEAHL